MPGVPENPGGGAGGLLGNPGEVWVGRGFPGKLAKALCACGSEQGQRGNWQERRREGEKEGRAQSRCVFLEASLTLSPTQARWGVVGSVQGR